MSMFAHLGFKMRRVIAWAMPLAGWLFSMPRAEAAFEPRSDFFGRYTRPPAYLPQALEPAFFTQWGKPWQVLVVFVDFDDKPARHEREYYLDMLFGRHDGVHEGKPYPYPTLADFYASLSGERLQFETPTIFPSMGWLRAPKPYTYYTAYAVENGVETANGCYGLGFRGLGWDTGVSRLVSVVLAQVEAAGIDLARFDNDGDAFIDPEGVLIVHAGPGGEQTASLTGEADCVPGSRGGDIWSHMNVQPVNGRLVSYVIGPAESIRSEDGRVSMGVWAHEFGHLLQLPDLYEPPNGGSYGYGVGCWDLMGYGIASCDPLFSGSDRGVDPAEMSVWTRMALAWAAPKPVTENVCNWRIDPVARGGQTFRITPRSDATYDYFLVEYRAQVGLDRDLPANTVCVWHVDDRLMLADGKTPNENQCIRRPGDAPDKCTVAHYGLALVQPDGKYDLEIGASPIDAGDCLLVGQELSSRSTLDLHPWSGVAPQEWRVRVNSVGEQASVTILVNPAAATAPPEIVTVPKTDPVRGRMWKYRPTLRQSAGAARWSLIKYPKGMTIDAETGLIAWRVPVHYASDEVEVRLQVENCGGHDEQLLVLAVQEAETGFWDDMQARCGCSSRSGVSVADGLPFAILAAFWWQLRRKTLGKQSRGAHLTGPISKNTHCS